jgi:hypothetical protein
MTTFVDTSSQSAESVAGAEGGSLGDGTDGETGG